VALIVARPIEPRGDESLNARQRSEGVGDRHHGEMMILRMPNIVEK